MSRPSKPLLVAVLVAGALCLAARPAGAEGSRADCETECHRLFEVGELQEGMTLEECARRLCGEPSRPSPRPTTEMGLGTILMLAALPLVIVGFILLIMLPLRTRVAVRRHARLVLRQPQAPRADPATAVLAPLRHALLIEWREERGEAPREGDQLTGFTVIDGATNHYSVVAEQEEDDVLALTFSCDSLTAGETDTAGAPIMDVVRFVELLLVAHETLGRLPLVTDLSWRQRSDEEEGTEAPVAPSTRFALRIASLLRQLSG